MSCNLALDHGRKSSVESHKKSIRHKSSMKRLAEDHCDLHSNKKQNRPTLVFVKLHLNYSGNKSLWEIVLVIYNCSCTFFSQNLAKFMTKFAVSNRKIPRGQIYALWEVQNWHLLDCYVLGKGTKKNAFEYPMTSSVAKNNKIQR